MKKQNPEKRHYIRIGASISVNYRILDTGKEEIDLVAGNISGGGIKIPVEKKLKLGTLLEIKLNFLNENKKIILKAKVVWTNTNRGSKKYPYLSGLEFVNINFAQRTMLSNYAQYLNRKELLDGL